MNLLLPALGAGLLLLLGIDVFVTVFHPEGHGGPLTRRQNSAVWSLWKKAAPPGDRRDAWLGVGGPVLAVLTPAVWSLLLVVGYALLYYPWIERFLASPGSLRPHWAEALYYSGFLAATLGTGDIVPDVVALRLLSIVEALSGFALLSAALSYILAIYRENGRKTTLASELALHFPNDGSPPRPGAVESERERWLEEAAREVVHITQAHAQYPILHYFRATDPRNSLALQLAPLVRLTGAREDERGRSTGDGAAEGGASAGSALVAQAVERYLIAADERFVRNGSSGVQNGRTGGRYARLLEYLAYDPEAGTEGGGRDDAPPGGRRP